MAPCRVPALINQGAHSMAPIMIIHADDVAAMATVVLLLLILVVFLMMMVVRWLNIMSIVVMQKVFRRMRYQSYWVVLTWESAVFGHVSSPVHVRPK